MICILVGSQLVQISGSTVLLTGATGGIGHAIARELHGRGGKLILTGRRADVLEPLAAELGARALAVDLSDSRRGRSSADGGRRRRHPRRQRRAAGSGRLETFTIEEIDRALDVNLRAPIALAHALAPGDGRARQRAPRCSCPRCPASRPRPAPRSTTRRSSGCAASPRPCATTCAPAASASPRLPRFHPRRRHVRRRERRAAHGRRHALAPRTSPRAIVQAIERNRAEVDVAPLPMRVGAAFAGIAPELSSRVALKLGAAKISQEIHAGQRDKR